MALLLSASRLLKQTFLVRLNKTLKYCHEMSLELGDCNRGRVAELGEGWRRHQGRLFKRFPVVFLSFYLSVGRVMAGAEGCACLRFPSLIMNGPGEISNIKARQTYGDLPVRSAVQMYGKIKRVA